MSVLLAESVELRAPPERVHQFFAQMAENYRRWHPDHISFEWLDGGRLEPGMRFRFAERIGGKLMTKAVRFTRIEPGLIEFTPTSWLLRLFLPSIRFVIEGAGERTRVRQEIHLRIGPLAARLNRREIEAVRRHMRDEGLNMKQLVESDAG
jgi:hypothetical protein